MKWPLGLTLNLLTTTIVAPPINASKWRMGFNSAFKGFATKGIENVSFFRTNFNFSMIELFNAHTVEVSGPG